MISVDFLIRMVHRRIKHNKLRCPSENGKVDKADITAQNIFLSNTIYTCSTLFWLFSPLKVKQGWSFPHNAFNMLWCEGRLHMLKLCLWEEGRAGTICHVIQVGSMRGALARDSCCSRLAGCQVFALFYLQFSARINAGRL